MASPTWAIGDQITAAKLNAIRDDIDSPSTGHSHDGTDSHLYLGPGFGFGDGSDGDVTISGTTTLTRNMFYRNLTVNSGQILNTAGYFICVSGTLTNAGYIQNNGGDASGSSGVAAPGAFFGGGTTGGQSVSASLTNSLGGRGGNCSSGGTAGTATPPTHMPRHAAHFLGMVYSGSSTPAQWTGGTGGGGDASGHSGAGGGGIVCIFARVIVNTSGVIRANGGAGGAYNGQDYPGGGGGGAVLVAYRQAAWGTEQALGGTSASSYQGAAGNVIKCQV